MPPRRTAHVEHHPEASGRSEKRDRVEPKRINVAVTPETVRALETLIEREGVSLTEAVRRLIGYGEFVYKAIKEQNSEVLVKSKDGSTREIVLL